MGSCPLKFPLPNTTGNDRGQLTGSARRHAALPQARTPLCPQDLVAFESTTTSTLPAQTHHQLCPRALASCGLLWCKMISRSNIRKHPLLPF